MSQIEAISLIEASKQALEALENSTEFKIGNPAFEQAEAYLRTAIASYSQAIAEAEKQEPLCTAAMFDDAFLAKSGLDPKTPLYTTPQQRTWVGLTDEDVRLASKTVAEDGIGKEGCVDRFAYVIEAKLKEKNT